MTTAVQTDYTHEERATAERLIEENYEMLIGIARAKRRRAHMRDTVSTLDLLHESFLKLDGRAAWASSEHFVRSAALAMRHVIIDHARKRQALKRGGKARDLPLDEAEGLMPEFSETPEQVIAISDLLEKLAAENPRWMRIVDARYFSGMTEAETARCLHLSERTVRRDWRDARAWIADKLGVIG